jgi:hypothetical protein
MRSGIDRVYPRAETMDSTLRHFGDVLFGELKEVIVRRGDIASLAVTKDRLDRAERQQCSHSIHAERIRIAQKLPGATRAVLELVRLIQSRTEAVLMIAKEDHEAALRQYERTSNLHGDSNRERDHVEGFLGGTQRRENEAHHIKAKLKDVQNKLVEIIDRASWAENGPSVPRAMSQVDDEHQEILDKLKDIESQVFRWNEDVESLADRCRAAVQDTRRFAIDDSIAHAARTAAMEQDLVGLAFSGGGIRSATFNLGILQGLADSGLIRTFDYLSTVSGGGYLGGWFAAWVHREKDIENVQTQLQPRRTQQFRATRRWLSEVEVQEEIEEPDLTRRQPVQRVLEEEPEPIYHLRRYSNYLAPRTGALSIDTWSMLSTYGRNFLLNQLIILSTAMVLILTPRLLLAAFQVAELPSWLRLDLGMGMLVLHGVGFGTVFLILLANRLGQRTVGDPKPSMPVGFLARVALQNRWPFFVFIFIPLGLGAVLFSFFFSRQGRAYLDLALPVLDPRFWQVRLSLSPGQWFIRFLLPSLAFGFLAGTFRSLCFFVTWLPWLPWRSAQGARPNRIGLGEFIRSGVFGLLAGTMSATVLYIVMLWLRTSLVGSPEQLAPTMMTFGPPLVVLAFLLISSLESGLLGADQEEGMREWRASLGAYLLFCTLGWTLAFGISLYGPLLIAAAGPITTAFLGIGWLAVSISGVLAGHSAKTRNSRGNTLDCVARFAPPVFVAGLSVLVSIVTCLAQGIVPPWGISTERGYQEYWMEMDRIAWGQTYVVWFLLLAVVVVFSTRLNVNLFSLHAFYANRLVRCYLGASRRKGTRPPGWPHFAPTNSTVSVRRPNPVTGFDPNDDIPLNELVAWHSGHLERGYQGPYPLINTALNLVSGKELAWQERKAESFVMTPLYAGSKSTGYRKMRISGPEAGADPGSAEATTGYGADLRLGTAVSISGAAASPNMGYHSSPAVTFLLTVFNARLGWWLGNPARESWRDSGPRWGFYLFKELFGKTDAESKYVYLSDGGHFENLGVYELIRRRCRYIVACDAGEDPSLAFWDLGSLVRKCREDLGVRIEIDIAPLAQQDPSGQSRWHCAIGKIRYDDVDFKAIPGILVYIKPSITGDEAVDIRNYVVEHPAFPHEPTANQFFSESQFESYRALGEHIAQEVFRGAYLDMERRVRSRGSREPDPSSLFEALHRRWFPPPPSLDEGFLKAVDSYTAVQNALRADPNLGRLSAELYPENGFDTSHYSLQDRAEIHAVGQMLQVMENVWLSVGLQSHAEHPMNRGWMNCFRRWSCTSVFQKCWPTLRGEFSQDFVRFAEEQLNLRIEPPKLEPYPGSGAQGSCFRDAIAALEKEFFIEWPRPSLPTDPDEPKGLVDRLAHAEKKANRPLSGVSAWLIPEPGAPGRSEDPKPRNGRACGVILAWKTKDRKLDGEVIELFVWIRGAYRTLGIGRHCVMEAIDRLGAQIRSAPKPLPLRVNYPLSDWAWSQDRWQSMGWLNFFQSLGFTKQEKEQPDLKNLTLYRFEQATSLEDCEHRDCR